MFGFGKKSKSDKKTSKSDDRYINRKDDEAVSGFLGSAKENSDRDAKKGGR